MSMTRRLFIASGSAALAACALGVPSVAATPYVKDYQVGVDVFSIETMKRPEQVRALLAELSKCRNLALGTKALYGAIINTGSDLCLRDNFPEVLRKVGKVERLLQSSEAANAGEHLRLEIPNAIRYWRESELTTDDLGNPLKRMFYGRSPGTLPLVLRPSEIVDGRVVIELSQQVADVVSHSYPGDGDVAPPPVLRKHAMDGVARMKPGNSFILAYHVQRSWSVKQYIVTIVTPALAS
jgi:hypothetical protein